MSSHSLTVFCLLFIAGCSNAACPNGLSDSIAQSMLNFVQSQFGQACTWNCTLEAQASKNASLCSLANSGAGMGSLKFSLPLDVGTSGTVAVQNHFQNNQGLKTISKSSSVQKVGCGFAECDKRVDIVCLFKNSNE